LGDSAGDSASAGAASEYAVASASSNNYVSIIQFDSEFGWIAESFFAILSSHYTITGVAITLGNGSLVPSVPLFPFGVAKEIKELRELGLKL
jgi:hypothetical protein